jgi:hypothetical protein
MRFWKRNRHRLWQQYTGCYSRYVMQYICNIQSNLAISNSGIFSVESWKYNLFIRSIKSMKTIQWAMRFRKSNDRKSNGQEEKWQKDKQWFTKQYTESKTLSNTNPPNHQKWTGTLRKGRDSCSASDISGDCFLLENSVICH